MKKTHATNMLKETTCSMMTLAKNLGLFHQHYLYHSGTSRSATFLETPSPLDGAHVKI